MTLELQKSSSSTNNNELTKNFTSVITSRSSFSNGSNNGDETEYTISMPEDSNMDLSEFKSGMLPPEFKEFGFGDDSVLTSATSSTTTVLHKRRTENRVTKQVTGVVDELGNFIPDKETVTVDTLNDHHVESESSVSTLTNDGKLTNVAGQTPTLALTNDSGVDLNMQMSLLNDSDFGKQIMPHMADNTAMSEIDRQLQLEQEIIDQLQRTQANFQNLLNQKRDLFVQMFPNLKNIAAESSLFKTQGNLITKEEGGMVTTTVKSQRQMASSTSQTFVNGVKKSAKHRAMLVYHGPTVGYTVNMQSDESIEDEEMSETEEDAFDEDRKSIAPSEVSFEPVPMNASDSVPTIQDKKKLTQEEKAYFVVNEMVETEDRYITKLSIIDKLRETVERENVDYRLLSKDKFDHIFANISSLYNFHNDHILPKLLERRRDWHSEKKMSNVFVELGPQLKMYGEYNSKRKRGAELHREVKKTCKEYREMVEAIENTPECAGLPLEAHMIEPVQRVPRYELLLQQYIKFFPEQHPDYHDTICALQLVQDAAKHANDIISKMEEYKAVLRIQNKLGTQIVNLVTPTRRLILQSPITKISATDDHQHQTRTLILFNDMLLLCSLPSGGNKGIVGAFFDKIYKIGVAELKLRAVVSVDGMQVVEGDRLDIENTFYVRGQAENKRRTIEFKAPKSEEKRLWMDTLSNIIQDHNTRMSSFNKNNAENTAPSPTCGQCPLCSVVLNQIKKERICGSCGMVVCKKCCTKKALDSERKDDLICTQCYKELKGGEKKMSHAKKLTDMDRKPSAHVKADDKSMMKGYLALTSQYLKNKLGGKWEKIYCVLKDDFVLYTFAGEKDLTPRTSLPMAGCKIEFASEKEGILKGAKDVPKSSEFFVFKITHSDRIYYLKADTAENMSTWMAILELASQSHTISKS